MGSFVLDTDVASFLFNQDPVRAPRYEALIRDQVLYLSFVSAAELRFGAELRNWGLARRARLELFLQDFIVVESAPDIARAWIDLRVHAQRCGRTIERQDAWVAAVALTVGLPLVSHNAAHFQNVPLLQVLTSPD